MRIFMTLLRREARDARAITIALALIAPLAIAAVEELAAHCEVALRLHLAELHSAYIEDVAGHGHHLVDEVLDHALSLDHVVEFLVDLGQLGCQVRQLGIVVCHFSSTCRA